MAAIRLCPGRLRLLDHEPGPGARRDRCCSSPLIASSIDWAPTRTAIGSASPCSYRRRTRSARRCWETRERPSGEPQALVGLGALLRDRTASAPEGGRARLESARVACRARPSSARPLAPVLRGRRSRRAAIGRAPAGPTRTLRRSRLGAAWRRERRRMQQRPLPARQYLALPRPRKANRIALPTLGRALTRRFVQVGTARRRGRLRASVAVVSLPHS